MSSLSDPDNIKIVWDPPEVAAALDPDRPATVERPAREGRTPGGGRGQSRTR